MGGRDEVKQRLEARDKNEYREMVSPAWLFTAGSGWAHGPPAESLLPYEGLTRERKRAKKMGGRVNGAALSSEGTLRVGSPPSHSQIPFLNLFTTSAATSPQGKAMLKLEV